jgi:uncharacterized protein YjhX (UPF0386 family)
MSVIATCGHTLTEKENLGKNILVKSYSKDGSHSVSYITVCNKCFNWHKQKKLILTEEQSEKWLKSGYKPNDNY